VLSLAAAFAVESAMGSRRRRRPEDIEPEARPVDVTDDDLDDDEGRAATHKMRPAPPPRQLPQPLRSGPRPAPRPPVGAVANVRRDIGPMGKPHPAKPRVQPAPVPTKVPNINGSPVNGNVVNGAKVNGSTVNGSTVNGNKPSSGGGGTNGVPQNGQGGTNREWPRTEFPSPDSPTG